MHTRPGVNTMAEEQQDDDDDDDAANTVRQLLYRVHSHTLFNIYSYMVVCTLTFTLVLKMLLDIQCLKCLSDVQYRPIF